MITVAPQTCLMLHWSSPSLVTLSHLKLYFWLSDMSIPLSVISQSSSILEVSPGFVASAHFYHHTLHFLPRSFTEILSSVTDP